MILFHYKDILALCDINLENGESDLQPSKFQGLKLKKYIKFNFIGLQSQVMISFQSIHQ